MKKQFLVLVHIMTTLAMFSQNEIAFKDLVSQSQQHYVAEKNYNIALQYSFYQSHTSEEIYESYSGKIVNQNQDFLFTMNTIEILASKGNLVKVSHDEKVILVSNYNGDNQSPTNLSIYESYFNTIHVFKKNGGYSCELSDPVMKQIPYHKIRIEFNDQYQITKQTIYFVSEVRYQNKLGQEQRSVPRLEIDFKEKSNKTVAINIEDYVHLKGEKMVLSNRLKDYQLIDNRIKN
ncbi:MAG: hypothetical protein HRT68_07590 [Flavobacteriaceae bacterium]|nr:hypothetical protein [Flavobacteriaceae bacterium]